MPEAKTCRVLIVDNRPDYAARVAEKLERVAQIHPSLLQHNKLQIELSNTAYFIAKKLQDSLAGSPPWDIIIADVYMPIPSRLPKREEAQEHANLTEYKYQGKVWPYWEYNYSWNVTLQGEVEHGGFHLAQTIRSLKDRSHDLSKLKLILTSRRLVGDDRARTMEYQKTASDWFKYYDKAEWEREGTLAYWPNPLEPDVFQWALILAIAEREGDYWGDSIYDIVPDADALIGATTSPQMQSVATEARRLGADSGIETILITGERGTGREVVARLIHEVRMKKLNLDGEFIGIDCSSIPDQEFEAQLFARAEEAQGGTFFVDEVDKLSPPQQGRLYHLLKDKRLRGIKGQTLEFKAQLAICTASSRNLDELNSSGLFHDDLYLILKDEHLHLTPLRERPEDIIPLAEITLGKNKMGVSLSDDACTWLKSYPWPRNARELVNVINVAARKSLTQELTQGDLRRIIAPEAKSDTAASLKSDSEITRPIENEKQQTRAFKAEPPFRLHWGESVLVDSKGRAIPLAENLYNVLKELVREEEGQYRVIKGKLTYAEIAMKHKSTGSFEGGDETQEIAHDFARKLRQALNDYSIDHYALIRTWKGYGYRMGNGWDSPPFIYKSESPLFFTDSVEEVERLQREKEIGRKRKLSPDY